MNNKSLMVPFSHHHFTFKIIIHENTSAFKTETQSRIHWTIETLEVCKYWEESFRTQKKDQQLLGPSLEIFDRWWKFYKFPEFRELTLCVPLWYYWVSFTIWCYCGPASGNGCNKSIVLAYGVAFGLSLPHTSVYCVCSQGHGLRAQIT